jgi:hypothetical protein
MPQFIRVHNGKIPNNVIIKKEKPLSLYIKNISVRKEAFKRLQLQKIRVFKEILRVLSGKARMH